MRLIMLLWAIAATYLTLQAILVLNSIQDERVHVAGAYAECER